MKLAIMQPYFFPYLGYFQLIFAADKFVFYDDVNYIKGGWINRNRILLDGDAAFFTIPVRGASIFVPINGVSVNEQNPKWRANMLDTVRMAYRHAPHRETGVALLEAALSSKCESIADLAVASVERVLDYLGFARTIVRSSATCRNRHLKGENRILDICRLEGAEIYINAIGGVALYREENFARQGCVLKFLRSHLPEYPQGAGRFVPGLSILDIIMHCAREEVVAMLPRHDLIVPAPAQAMRATAAR